MKDIIKSDKKDVLELSYIGTDDWSRPVYKDQYEKLWKDIELGDRETPSLCSVVGNDFDGEPNCLIRKEFLIVTPFVKNNKKFEYMMLGRLKSDCDTHLDIECARRLSESERKSTIETMKNLWNGFEDDEKPEWLTWEQILDYEKRMI
ncbi:MAG: LPD11 domain-containing protein [Bacillota bacterium]